MEADEILKLFDSYWFQQQIFTLKRNSPAPAANFSHPVEESKPFAMSNLQVRSSSDPYLSFNPSKFFKDETDKELPNTKPAIQKILSGKEMLDFCKVAAEARTVQNEKSPGKRKKGGNGKIIRSLSGLEFEEVKGFMDLGFVFSEEDKSSSLVSMIPGLQKLGKNGEVVNEKVQVSRPYLSEAWGALKQGKPEMMNWSIQSVLLYSEINMKDKLRVWAQTVASTVR